MDRRIAIFAVVLIAVPLVTNARADAVSKQPEGVQYAAKGDVGRPDVTLTPGAPKEQPAPKIYQPDCGKPQDHDEADLCVQLEAVKASRNAVGWAQAQTIIGAVGLAGVIVSLLLAGWAAHESRKSAKASRESAEIARRTFSELQRPWMFLSIDEIRRGQRESGYFIEVSFTYKNAGGGPALIDSHAASILLFSDEPDEVPEFPEPARWNRVIPVGEKTETLNQSAHRMQRNRWDDIRNRRVLLCLCGSIRYRSVSGDPGLTEFFMPYDYRRNAFLPEGRKHNRHT